MSIRVASGTPDDSMPRWAHQPYPQASPIIFSSHQPHAGYRSNDTITTNTTTDHDDSRYSVDASNTHDEDSSSSGSSLDEDDIRDVVRHVMQMVRHSRRGQSTSTTDSFTSTFRATSDRNNVESNVQGEPRSLTASLRAPSGTTEASTHRGSASPVLGASRGGRQSLTDDARRAASPSIQVPRTAFGAGMPRLAHPAEYRSVQVLQPAEVNHVTSRPTQPNGDVGRAPRIDLGKDAARSTAATTVSKFSKKSLTTGHLHHTPLAQQRASPPKVRREAGGSRSASATAMPLMSGAALPFARGESFATVDSSAAAAAPDSVHLSLEQRRAERVLKIRSEALAEETFTPRTSLSYTMNDSSAEASAAQTVVPRNIRDVPVRAGRWEDRLYTEYHNRKMQRDLEYEALRLAKQAHQELQETLEECTFAPDLDKIHRQQYAGGCTLSRSASQRGSRSRSTSAEARDRQAEIGARTETYPHSVGVADEESAKDKAQKAAERLYAATIVLKDRAAREADAAKAEQQKRAQLERQQERIKAAKPTDAQLRLFNDHERRKADHQRLVEEYKERQRTSCFSFNIKGTLYETLPLPVHADPGAFQRLYEDTFERQEHLVERIREAEKRRPSPVPKITEYAKTRIHPSLPAHERLSTPVNRRTQSPHAPQNLVQNSSLVALSPLTDAIHRGVDASGSHLQPPVRTAEYVLSWMSKTAATPTARTPVARSPVLSRENSLLKFQQDGVSIVLAPPGAKPMSPILDRPPSRGVDASLTPNQRGATASPARTSTPTTAANTLNSAPPRGVMEAFTTAVQQQRAASPADTDEEKLFVACRESPPSALRRSLCSTEKLVEVSSNDTSTEDDLSRLVEM